MAPYNPPNVQCYYSQLNVSEFGDDEHIFEKLIGKSGYKFYNLTKKLKVQYLWYDTDRKVIEIWGSHQALKNGAKERLRLFCEKHKKSVSDSNSNN